MPGIEIATSMDSSASATDLFSDWIFLTRPIVSPASSMSSWFEISLPAMTLTPNIAGAVFLKTYSGRTSSLQIFARPINLSRSISFAFSSLKSWRFSINL